MKKGKGRKNVAVLSALAVAALLIYGMFSLIAEPPHIVHEIFLDDAMTVVYYEDSPYYKDITTMRVLDVTVPAGVNMAGVYKSRLGAYVKDTYDESPTMIMYTDPVCYSVTDQGYTKTQCDYDDSAIFASVGQSNEERDGSSNRYVEAPLPSALIADRIGLATDYDGEKVKLNDVYLYLYEAVECTDDTHCVSAAPTCNLVTNKCEAVVIEPPKPEPSGLSALISDLLDWIKAVFDQFFYLAITGDTVVTPGEVKTYSIDISVAKPDHDHADGTYQTQYAYWALVDADGNILEGQTAGVEIDGNYVAEATVTIPFNYNNYILIAAVEQIDSTYDFSAQSWTHGDAVVIVKEALDLTSSAPEIVKPAPSGLGALLTGLIEWLKGLFDWLL